MDGAEAERRLYKKTLEAKREIDHLHLKDKFKLLDGNKKAMMNMILAAIEEPDSGVPIAFVVVFAKPGFLDSKKADDPTAVPETIIFEMSSGVVMKYTETELKDTLVAALEKWVERTYSSSLGEFAVTGKF